MAATIILWRKHMVKFFRSREAAFGMLMQPILWVVLFGVGMQAMFRSSEMGFAESDSYIAFMMPGIIVLSALAGAVAGGAILLDERLRGIIKEYLASPIPRSSILMGSAASTVTKGLFQALVITLIGALLGAAVILNPLNWLAALLVVALYSLGIAGLALAVAARVRSSLGYHGLIALDLPLVFASSAFYPLALMPDWMRWIALFNPTTYVIEVTRWLLYGIPIPSPLSVPLALGVLLLFATLSMVLAARVFQREVRSRGGAV
jgi:ABC-2 type transport system permease protein